MILEITDDAQGFLRYIRDLTIYKDTLSQRLWIGEKPEIKELSETLYKKFTVHHSNGSITLPTVINSGPYTKDILLNKRFLLLSVPYKNGYDAYMYILTARSIRERWGIEAYDNLLMALHNTSLRGELLADELGISDT